MVHTSDPASISSSVDLSSPLDADFVTCRGHLTKLLTTPYETCAGWLLAVTRFKGTLYISEVETEAARRDRQNRTEKHKEMMYWGYKFEQYTCAGRAVMFTFRQLHLHKTLYGFQSNKEG